jgi:SH3 domain-containing protein
MKRCPACSTTYTDESLRYCLADGTTLTSAEAETVLRSAATDPLRIDIPTAASEPTAAIVPRRESFPWGKIVIAIVALGFIGMVILGVGGAAFYFGTARAGDDQNKKATPTPLASPSVDPEKKRLEEQLANAQKQLDDQKNANRPADLDPVFPTPPKTDQPGVVTARVNSPGDGFLAMRSEPSSDYGERLAKIPHGATVKIENCEREKMTIGRRTGRWCLVTYGDNTGWVFDAWLDR